MPMGNRMGPEGMGPRTGRGAGYCNGNDMPGTYNRQGRGFGAGRHGGSRHGAGRFSGRGMRAGSYGSLPDEGDLLKQEADFLEKRLEAVRSRLNELENDSE